MVARGLRRLLATDLPALEGFEESDVDELCTLLVLIVLRTEEGSDDELLGSACASLFRRLVVRLDGTVKLCRSERNLLINCDMIDDFWVLRNLEFMFKVNYCIYEIRVCCPLLGPHDDGRSHHHQESSYASWISYC